MTRLRYAQRFRAQLMQCIDASIVMVVVVVVYFQKETLLAWLDSFAYTGIKTTDSLTGLFYILIILVPLFLEKFKFYKNKSRQSILMACIQLVGAWLVLTLVMTIIPFLLSGAWTDKNTLRFIVGVLASGGILCRFVVTHFYQKRLDKNPFYGETLLVVGEEDNSDFFWKELDINIRHENICVGIFNMASRSVEDLPSVLEENSVSRVILRFGALCSSEAMVRVIEICEVQGIEIWMSNTFVKTRIAHAEFDQLGGKEMIVFRSTPTAYVQLFFKYLLDKIGAVFLICLTSPIWLLAVIVMKIKAPGPVFFKQMRSGKYGRPFMMWKFRTMVVGADSILDKVKETHGNEMNGPIFKLENDPRIIPCGHIMRKLSIDELPQLINILLGDMSLVGPRPLPVYEVKAFKSLEDRRRLSVKPGLTCYWQIEGRSNLKDFDDVVRLDVKYIDNWSFFLDIKLLLRTVPAVLLGKGAK